MLLEIRDLWTHVKTAAGPVPVIRGVNLQLDRGESLAIVGESGSGKSMTCQSIVRLVDPRVGGITSGQILLDGEDLVTASPRRMRGIRGKKIGMVLQDPHTALNPALTVGYQIREVLKIHQGLRGAAARTRSRELLEAMQIPESGSRLASYPHELSGGTRQRVVAAIALACEPELLIADEPTTALDVTIQAGFLRLLKDLQRELDFGLIFVTHDLGIVNSVCERVAVMYAGQIVESAPTDALFREASHPYSSALLNLAPDVRRIGVRPVSIPGSPPAVGSIGQGCAFQDRCAHTVERCSVDEPELTEVSQHHSARCWVAGSNRAARSNSEECVS